MKSSTLTCATGTHAVRVHHLRTSTVGEAALVDAAALLSSSEGARAARFRFAHDRRQHVLLSALARRVLARSVGGDDVLARAITFTTGAHGRPEVAGPAALAGVRFNLSKTLGLVVCAVTEELDIGVDVEHLARAIDVDEVAPVALHPQERDALAELGSDERRQAFLRLWTLKEAYAKARGLGLTLPVERLAFALEGDRVRAHFDAAIGDDPCAWTFHMLSPTATHQIAVVVAESALPVDVTLADAAALFAPGSPRAPYTAARPSSSLCSDEVSHVGS